MVSYIEEEVRMMAQLAPHALQQADYMDREREVVTSP